MRNIRSDLHPLGIEALLDVFQIPGGERLSPYNIEMTPATATLGIHIVAFTGHRHHSPLMEQLRHAELGLQRVANVALAERDSWLSMTAVGITRLYHKVLDDTVEEQRVVEVVADETEEVVAMDGRLVEELYAYVALGGLE